MKARKAQKTVPAARALERLDIEAAQDIAEIATRLSSSRLHTLRMVAGFNDIFDTPPPPSLVARRRRAIHKATEGEPRKGGK